MKISIENAMNCGVFLNGISETTLVLIQLAPKAHAFSVNVFRVHKGRVATQLNGSFLKPT
jgi:hypothetical protein